MTKPDQAMKRVEELDKLATKGPWKAEISDQFCCSSDVIHFGDETKYIGSIPTGDDANLIAEYRTLCPLLKDEVVRLQEIERKYCQLIMTVGNKHPNETRHETALRYIKQAEMVSNKATQQVK